MTVEVSIIIPAKNEAANIGRCLDAVFGQKTKHSFEVIVIDSGSEDDTAEIATRRPVKLIKIRAEEFDHGATRNLGFENSAGKYLVALVADAVPADRWLDELIAPLESDPLVAGAYSRQIPPPDLNPLAAARFAGLDPSRLVSETRSWPGDEAWQSMPPMEKLRAVEFDDVSSVRRKSVWEKIPVAANYWAEDVDWSIKALRAGYKIAYAAQSVVVHGHKPSLRHEFKRAFVDQREASRRFGIVLYANPREAFDSWVRSVARDFETISSIDIATHKKVYWAVAGPLRRTLEVAGGYLAGKSDSPQNVYRDLYAGFAFTSRKGDLRKTVFSVGGKRCNAVFAHPPSAWEFNFRVPRGGKLSFMAGVNSDAHDLCGEIKFEASINGAVVWSGSMNPSANAGDRLWKNVEVDLAAWENKKISVRLSTSAENVAHAWAGWGEPRVVALEASFGNNLKNKIAAAIEKAVTRTPPRHP